MIATHPKRISDLDCFNGKDFQIRNAYFLKMFFVHEKCEFLIFNAHIWNTYVSYLRNVKVRSDLFGFCLVQLFSFSIFSDVLYIFGFLDQHWGGR